MCHCQPAVPTARAALPHAVCGTGTGRVCHVRPVCLHVHSDASVHGRNRRNRHAVAWGQGVYAATEGTAAQHALVTKHHSRLDIIHVCTQAWGWRWAGAQAPPLAENPHGLVFAGHCASTRVCRACSSACFRLILLRVDARAYRRACTRGPPHAPAGQAEPAATTRRLHYTHMFIRICMSVFNRLLETRPHAQGCMAPGAHALCCIRL